MQIIGRVDTGFSQAERRELADRLGMLRCESVLNISSRSGLPYQWVLPQMIVEVACHELLTTTSDGELTCAAKNVHVVHHAATRSL